MRAVSGPGALGKCTDASVPQLGVVDRAWSVDAVAVGQAVIDGMRRTTGTGSPDRGDAFGRGADAFSGASDTARSAHPRDDWSGNAATAYARGNATQAIRAGAMAALDRSVEAVVAREADQIAYRRGRLDHHAGQLSELARATRSLGLLPGVGPAMRRAFELAAVHAAVGSAGDELSVLSGETARNATALYGLATHYASLIDASLIDVDAAADPGRAPAADITDGDITDGDITDEDRGGTAPPAGDRHGAAAVSCSVMPSSAPPPGERSDPAVAASPAGAAAAPPPPLEAPAASDPLAGLASSLGVVGGLVGTVLSPLAAVVTGAVAAAAQAAPATMSDTGADSVAPDGDGSPSAATTEEEGDGPADQGQHIAPAESTGTPEPTSSEPSPRAIAESAASDPSPATTVEPEPTPAPPAATRPPR